MDIFVYMSMGISIDTSKLLTLDLLPNGFGQKLNPSSTRLENYSSSKVAAVSK